MDDASERPVISKSVTAAKDPKLGGRGPVSSFSEILTVLRFSTNEPTLAGREPESWFSLKSRYTKFVRLARLSGMVPHRFDLLSASDVADVQRWRLHLYIGIFVQPS